tara:strand:- start:9750 stop:11171 length:1422 start_codon:yes stop_codon:yes gene_type:complete
LYSNKIKKLKKTTFIFLGLFIIYGSVTENLILLLFPLILISSYKLALKPCWLAYLFILSNVQFLGFIDPESFIRLPGIFKFTDIIFILLCFVFLFDVLKNGYKKPIGDTIYKSISYIVLSFLLIVIIQFVMTYTYYDVPLISTIKVGRGYLYLFVFFYFIQFFNTVEKLKQLIYFLFIVALIQAIFMVFQILGFDFTVSTSIRELGDASDKVTRVYLPAYFYAALCFYIGVSFILSKVLISYKKRLFCITLMIFLSILFSYTRTYWVAIILGMFSIYLFSRKKVKEKIVKKVMIASVILLPVLTIQADGFMAQRFTSIFNEVGSDEGNFIFRFTENPQRIEAFIDNPILGPGFVHSSYAANIFNFIIDTNGLSESQIERALLLQTNDSGLITLLVTFGLAGVTWVISKLLILIKLQRKQCIPIESALRVASLAFIISIWGTSATTYGFTYPDGIVALAIALFIFNFNFGDKGA